MTHQELLDRYWKAQCSVISEWSGDIIRDEVALHAEVVRYALTNGLVPPDREDYWQDCELSS